MSAPRLNPEDLMVDSMVMGGGVDVAAMPVTADVYLRTPSACRTPARRAGVHRLNGALVLHTFSR